VLDELDGDPDFEEQHDHENDDSEWGIADRDALELIGPTLAPDRYPSAA